MCDFQDRLRPRVGPVRHVLLFSRLCVAGQEYAGCAVAQENSHRFVIGLAKEYSRQRGDNVRDCDYLGTEVANLSRLFECAFSLSPLAVRWRYCYYRITCIRNAA
jgi:hypothetical protein